MDIESLDRLGTEPFTDKLSGRVNKWTVPMSYHEKKRPKRGDEKGKTERFKWVGKRGIEERATALKPPSPFWQGPQS